jgi:hypothetical protein
LFLDEDLVCQATPRPTESKPEWSDFISACIHLERTTPQRPALRRGEVVPNTFCKHQAGPLVSLVVLLARHLPVPR